MLEVPGIDINAKDSNGRTIVEVAKEVGNQGVEKLLVEKCESWQEWKDLDEKKQQHPAPPLPGASNVAKKGPRPEKWKRNDFKQFWNHSLWEDKIVYKVLVKKEMLFCDDV